MKPAMYVLQKLSVQYGKLYSPSGSGVRTSPAVFLPRKVPEHFLASSARCEMSVRLFPQIPAGLVLCESVPYEQFHR